MNLNELICILKNARTVEEIDRYREDILKLIPKIRVMIDFDQCNHAHQYNLWEHCLHTVINLPDDIDDNMIYLAALIHDIGKPDCQTYSEKDGKINMHYYGHPVRSMKITRDDIIPELIARGQILSEYEQRRLLYYVEYHDDHVSLRIKHLRRHLNMGAGLEEFKNLMKLQVADAKAHVILPIIQERIKICEQLSGEYVQKLYEEIRSDLS